MGILRPHALALTASRFLEPDGRSQDLPGDTVSFPSLEVSPPGQESWKTPDPQPGGSPNIMLASSCALTALSGNSIELPTRPAPHFKRNLLLPSPN